MENFEQQLAELQNRLKTDTEFRNQTAKCPACGQHVGDRQAALYRGLILTFYSIYCWCGEHKCHEFERKNVEHLIKGSDYARFGDLIRFGGLVYRAKNPKTGRKENGWYGINMARAKQFFKGEYKIPVQITLNQLTNEIIDARYVAVNEFPELYSLLDANGVYDFERDLIQSQPQQQILFQKTLA